MSISKTIESMDACIQALESNPGAASDAERQQLLAAAKRLQAASESPIDTIISITLGVSISSTMRVYNFDSKIDIFTEHPPSELPWSWAVGIQEGGISAKGLGEKTGGDPLLISELVTFAPKNVAASDTSQPG